MKKKLELKSPMKLSDNSENISYLDLQESNANTSNTSSSIEEIICSSFSESCNVSIKQILEKCEFDLKANDNTEQSSKNNKLLYSNVQHTNIETQVLQSMICFMKHKEYSYDRAKHFSRRNPVFASTDSRIEKNLYEAIDRLVRKFSEVSQAQMKDHFKNIDKLIVKLTSMNSSLESVAIKSIVTSVLNIIREWAIDVQLHEQSWVCGMDGEIFKVIYSEYILIIQIGPCLEKVFSSSLEAFRTKSGISFSLSELILELFWEFIFRIKPLCSFFIEFYDDIGVLDSSKNVMKKIVHAISQIHQPLITMISQYLNFPIFSSQIRNIHLADAFLISKFNEEKSAYKDRGRDNDEDSLRLTKSISEQSGNSNGISETLSQVERKNSSGGEGEKYATIDELYNYILNDDTKRENKKKKKKKKSRKNTYATEDNNCNNNIPNDCTLIRTDPVVENFKYDLTREVSNARNISKIKPVLTNEWLEFISLLDS